MYFQNWLVVGSLSPLPLENQKLASGQAKEDPCIPFYVLNQISISCCSFLLYLYDDMFELLTFVHRCGLHRALSVNGNQQGPARDFCELLQILAEHPKDMDPRRRLWKDHDASTMRDPLFLLDVALIAINCPDGGLYRNPSNQNQVATRPNSN